MKLRSTESKPGMCNRSRRSTSGIALIVALLMIVFFGILAADFALSMKVETKLARNASHDVEFEWLGRSGIELARYYLAMEALEKRARGGPPVYSLFDRSAGGPGFWEMPGGPGGPTGPGGPGGPGDRPESMLDQIPLKDFHLGNGTLSVTIEDMDRKWNINSVDEVILREALGSVIGVEGDKVASIVDSILDWRDPDDNPRVSGAESETYQNYSPPYFAKNGPIEDLSELLLVRGVTPAIYWGSAGGSRKPPVMNPLPQSWRGFEATSYAVGLVQLFTTTSSGVVNVNTASEEVLRVIPGFEPIVDRVLSERSKWPFMSIQEMSQRLGGIPIPPPLMMLLGVTSSVFEVRVSVRIDNEEREYVALLNTTIPLRVNPTFNPGFNPTSRKQQDPFPVLYMYWQHPSAAGPKP